MNCSPKTNKVLQELELAVVKTAHAKRHYVLEVKSDLSLELRKAIMFAQERFLEEIEENGYNVLLSERLVISILLQIVLL